MPRDLLVSLERQSVSARTEEPGPFQDVPKSVWTIFLGAWGLLFVMFGLFFAVDTASGFVVTIAALFAL